MSAKKVIKGGNIPVSSLPFSPAIISGGHVFVSGQASTDDQGNIVNDTFAGECRRSFDNLKRIVEAAGATLNDAVQVRNYVGKQEYLAEFNAIYKEYFQEPYPARTTLIGCLGELLKFEVDAVFLLPE
ncbi:RidA family protein [Dyadobacter sp. CY323]|uniref:RidA family protein n=1 Tax=Dyadobacter sp. CY323 TaxID=2907302 RepID=UPI001F204715|nr:RidA family protein [Dyadobacter sp. CY323]MCE6988565.1 RidA family protein [Dyadobacter sp. CY323]